MKNFIILICLCAAAYILYDLQSVKLALNKSLRDGTLQGVENCVAYSRSELVSVETTRNVCVENFHIELFDGDFATGRAGPKDMSGEAGWAGTLENKTAGHVTTWVRVSVSLFDADGKEKEYEANTYVWIEPQSSTNFQVGLSELAPSELKSVEFCDRDDGSPKSCVSWGIVRIKGIKI